MDNDRTSFLRTVSFCAGLPDPAITALAAIAMPLQRPAGAFIQFEGDPADAMYLVIRGRVKIARTSASGASKY
jgi:CRP-like cAMP-binding protein